jgi:hypothetical protein
MEYEYYFWYLNLKDVGDSLNSGMFTTLTAGEFTPMPWTRIRDLLPIHHPTTSPIGSDWWAALPVERVPRLFPT